MALEEHEAEAPAGLGLAELRALRAEALNLLLGILGVPKEELAPKWCHVKHALLIAVHAQELAGMLSGEEPELSERCLELLKGALALAEELLKAEKLNKVSSEMGGDENR